MARAVCPVSYSPAHPRTCVNRLFQLFAGVRCLSARLKCMVQTSGPSPQFSAPVPAFGPSLRSQCPVRPRFPAMRLIRRSGRPEPRHLPGRPLTMGGSGAWTGVALDPTENDRSCKPLCFNAVRPSLLFPVNPDRLPAARRPGWLTPKRIRFLIAATPSLKVGCQKPLRRRVREVDHPQPFRQRNARPIVSHAPDPT